MKDKEARPWAVILGVSSGFGAAVAKRLAGQGFSICGIHLDRRSTIEAANDTKSAVEKAGGQALFFNVNACDPTKREAIVAELANSCQPGECRLLFHSLAFGSLVPVVGPQREGSAKPSQVAMTLDVMANSLIYWAQDLIWNGLIGRGGRILAMSSAGSTRAMHGYGLVSGAKCALEAYIRQLALELGPQAITANTIRAGVTDTAALRKIPGYEAMKGRALELNPGGRLTRPEDVAGMVSLLVDPAADWVSGNVIGVDGGEDVAAP